MNARMYVVKTIFVLSLSAMVAVGMWARTSAIKKQGESSKMEETLTGIVSDSLCGSTHSMKSQDDAERTRLCVRIGCQYALAVGKNTYMLEGHQAEVDRYAGDKVTVKGTVGRDAISVESVCLVSRGAKP